MLLPGAAPQSENGAEISPLANDCAAGAKSAGGDEQ